MDMIIGTQKEICRKDPEFLLLTRVTEQLVTQPEYMNPHARGHFNCRGQEKIGTLAGYALGIWA